MMGRLYLGSSLTAVLLGSVCGVGNRVAAAEPVCVVAFGDSTTAPRGKLRIYSKILQDELPARGVQAEVVNAGIGGNNTNHARKRFEKDVLERKPGLVVIQFGINDSVCDVWRKPPSTKPRVPKEHYEKNLRYFVSKLKERGAKVILMTPNPLRWTPKLKKLYGKPPYDAEAPDGFNLFLKQYAESVRQIAAAEKVPLIDVYAAFEGYGKKRGQSVEDLLLDGMHPNDRGQRIVADLLLEKVPAVLGKQ